MFVMTIGAAAAAVFLAVLILVGAMRAAAVRDPGLQPRTSLAWAGLCWLLRGRPVDLAQPSARGSSPSPGPDPAPNCVRWAGATTTDYLGVRASGRHGRHRGRVPVR